MEQINLAVQTRSKIGTQACHEIRRGDFIPAVVYGGKSKPASIQVDRSCFERLERQHHGESIVVSLEVMEGEKKLKNYPAIIKEIQHDPVTDKILHVDFHHISLTKVIEVSVPIVAKGEPIGVKKEGGSLDHHLWELEIECLPTQIPQHIDVEVSKLRINESIYVKDLLVPQGIKVKMDPEETVLTVIPPMKEEEVGEEAAVASGEPEVIKEKKKEESTPKAEQGGSQEKKPEKEKTEGS